MSRPLFSSVDEGAGACEAAGGCGTESPSATALSRAPEHPVRAARRRLGLSQEAAAQRANVPLATFKRWDRGEKEPRHATRAAEVARALNTTVEALWGSTAGGDTPDGGEQLELTDAVAATEVAPTTVDLPPSGTGADASDHSKEPVPDQGSFSVPATPGVPTRDLGAALRAIDEADAPRFAFRGFRGPAVRAPLPGIPRASRRLIGVAALAATVVAMVSIGIAGRAGSANGPDRYLGGAGAARTTAWLPAPPTRAVSRSGAWVAMSSAAGRGDYDRAIDLADDLGDDAARQRYRHAAAAVLLRRADAAADRGETHLASLRLARVKRRYGTVSAANTIADHVRRIEQQRRAAAERRAGEQRARARRSPVQIATRSTGSSSAATTRATPVPSTTRSSPTPKPTPAPSSAGGSKSGGSSSSGGAVDPGLY